jgi:hypothetical protein
VDHVPGGPSRPRAGRGALLTRWLPWILAAGLAALTGHPICDAVFDCGCTWPFAGAAAHCNVRTPEPPNCPPCSSAPVGIVFGLALYAGWWGVARAGVALAASASRR